jgi:mono/diheme cytochrome c family protein
VTNVPSRLVELFAGRRLQATVAILVAGLAGVAVGCYRPSDRREARDFERMRRQQRYSAYDTASFFRDGKVLQAPPAHTVSRDAAYAAATISSASAVAASAAKQFVISCAPCHGDGGFGGGTIAANLSAKRPPSLRTSTVAALPTEQLVSVITEGVGRMPPLGWQMPLEARIAVAAYVHSLNTVPVTDAARRDSVSAAYLHDVDSLNASGANLGTVLDWLRAHRPPR